MTRILIIFGLAVLLAPVIDWFMLGVPVVLPDWLVVAGGAAFGGAVSYRMFRRISL